MLQLILASILAATPSIALNDGFGRIPVMGYNSYNDVGCSPNSTYMETTMHALVNRKLSALGYKFFQIDCGWQGYERQSNGSITYDATSFPDGIKPLSELAISLGLKWSMYTDEGVRACDTSATPRPGSRGYEKQDALQFAGWNVDYLKVDNCYVNGSTPADDAPKFPLTDLPTRYGAMSDALQAVGIEGMLVCEWGVPYDNVSYGLQGPYAWTPPLATSYRVSDDIAEGFANVLRITNEAIHVNLQSLSGPGHFADMDLLEVGNPGMTIAEQRTHFAIWALFKSTLMISTNVPQMSSETYNILSNQNLIAINQDSLGEPISLVQRYTCDYDLYSGNLANGDLAVFAFDQSNSSRELSIDFSSQFSIQSATVKNLGTGAVTKSVSSYSQSLAAHGNIALRLSDVEYHPSPAQDIVYQPFSSASLSGGAELADCLSCATGKKVGNLGSGATATLSGFSAAEETMNVDFDYINCEIGYLSTQGTNVRAAGISVNGGAVQRVDFPLSGYDWERDVLRSYRVQLSGFNSGSKDNTIAVTAYTSYGPYAPDFDRVGVPA